MWVIQMHIHICIHRPMESANTPLERREEISLRHSVPGDYCAEKGGMDLGATF